ncbi:hypothetical protein [Luteipulveratus mongoliensis]|uniref:Uncharacterized protein n=1 Tax=Luteipulveratus mongoliensis TaxID=571913 RepID=A0A0K1JMM3_9MICO|nr:hypothetical protein [Luteipulveratus mongoliensis]AKU17825.1 hypothetical protein VV02_21465 [Luteipulveratus mongoliensis]
MSDSDLHELEDRLRSEYDAWSPAEPDRAALVGRARERAGALRRRRTIATGAVAVGGVAAITAASVFAGQLSRDSTSIRPGSRISSVTETRSAPLDAATLLPHASQLEGMQYHATTAPGARNTDTSQVRAGREPKVAGQICGGRNTGHPVPISSINDWTSSSPAMYFAMNAIARYAWADAPIAFDEAKRKASPCSWSAKDNAGVISDVTIGIVPEAPSTDSFTVTQFRGRSVTVVRRVEGYIVSSVFTNNLSGSTPTRTLRLKALEATNVMATNLRAQGLVK